MNVQTVRGWRCAHCDVFVPAKDVPLPQVAYRLTDKPVSVLEDDGLNLRTVSYVFTQPERVMVRVCPRCGDPTPVDQGGDVRVYYRCGECDEVYTDRVEAKVCCTGDDD